MQTIKVLLIMVGMSCIASANYLEKTSIEKGLEAKAQHILDTMFGPHLFSVNASVDLSRESWVVSYTDRAKIEFTQTEQTPSEKYKILPGYSAIKNLSPNEAVQMPFNSKISKLPSDILKIRLDIVASKKIPKQDAKTADKVLTKILMLNSDRGDKINFEFQDFPIDKTNEEVKVALPIEAKMMILVLIITSIFLIVYILLQMKLLKISQEAVKAQQETAKATAAAASSGGSSAPEPMPEALPVSSSATNEQEEAGGYFSFVGPHNAKPFVEIIKKADLDIDALSMVVSYLSPPIAKMAMELFEDAKQTEIITALMDEKIADKDTLDELEDTMKSQLACSVGGSSKLSAVIGMFSDASKKSFLSTIQSNADLYSKVRCDIFMFEDIEKLEDNEVKKLIGALNIEVLAASIAKDEGPAGAKLKSNLTGAAQAMVGQFIDLKKESLTDADVVNAQSKVVHQMKLLNDQGAIDLVAKIIG